MITDSPSCTETEDSLSRLQENPSRPCPEPTKSSPHLPTQIFKISLILCSYLYHDPPDNPILSVYPRSSPCMLHTSSISSLLI
jgi:hypothetical protein